MTPRIIVNFNHPANAGILKYLGHYSSYDTEPEPYWPSNGHPDLIDRLWDEITIKLPSQCRWTINGTAVLVHAITGIIFGCAGWGMHPVMLRLPESLYEEALKSGAKATHDYSDGSKLDLAILGKGWLFGNWKLDDEADWCLAAYEFAGEAV